MWGSSLSPTVSGFITCFFLCGGKSSHSTHTIAHSEGELVICVWTCVCVSCQCHRRLLLMGQSTQPVTLHLSVAHTRAHKHMNSAWSIEADTWKVDFCTALSNISRLEVGRVSRTSYITFGLCRRFYLKGLCNTLALYTSWIYAFIFLKMLVYTVWYIWHCIDMSGRFQIRLLKHL